VLSLSLFGCDTADNKEVSVTKEITTLTDKNIKTFTKTLLKDYVEARSELLAQFKTFKKANDKYGFAKYRNHTWTPKYIEKKEYYNAVLDENRAYIDKAGVKPLFLRFENLLYIGVNLKNSLLNDDDELLQTTYAEIKEDHATISKFKK